MIAEASRRTEGFDPGSVWIPLADGQPWGFPRPWLELRATFRDGVAVDRRPALSYGLPTDELIEAIGAAGDDAVRISGVATLAARLLRVNYELDDRELDGLLAFRTSDPASLAWVTAVVEVAVGGAGRRGMGAVDA